MIVFGYPSSRFSSTATYFKSLAEGGTTAVEQSDDIENAFRIGYKHPWDAARACMKNGEIISIENSRWMVGAKWEVSRFRLQLFLYNDALQDPQLAERVLGSASRTPSSLGSAALNNSPQAPNNTGFSSTFHTPFMNRVDSDQEPRIGTPIRLAPSSTAFRKYTGSPQKSTNTGQAANSASVKPNSPAKGIVGQVSDLIFGW